MSLHAGVGTVETAQSGLPGSSGTSVQSSPPANRGPRVLSLLASRPAWVLAALIVIVALGIGSVHPRAPSETARIAHLDSVIKCPSCMDLSIAQSDAPIAVALRAEVAAWVRGGVSDARIEQRVVARFGEQVLLVPTGSGADVLLWVVPISLVGGGAVLLVVYLWRRRRLEAPA